MRGRTRGEEGRRSTEWGSAEVRREATRDESGKERMKKVKMLAARADEVEVEIREPSERKKERKEDRRRTRRGRGGEEVRPQDGQEHMTPRNPHRDPTFLFLFLSVHAMLYRRRRSLQLTGTPVSSKWDVCPWNVPLFALQVLINLGYYPSAPLVRHTWLVVASDNDCFFYSMLLFFCILMILSDVLA